MSLFGPSFYFPWNDAVLTQGYCETWTKVVWSAQMVSLL